MGNVLADRTLQVTGVGRYAAYRWVPPLPAGLDARRPRGVHQNWGVARHPVHHRRTLVEHKGAFRISGVPVGASGGVEEACRTS